MNNENELEDYQEDDLQQHETELEQTDFVESESEETLEPEQPQIDPGIEAKAREMGWVGKEEFRGPENAWRPADEFVERGEQFLPIVRSQLKKEQLERQQLAQAMVQKEAEFNERLERMGKVYQAANEKQRLFAARQIEQEKRQAVETGDLEAFDNLSRREMDLYQEFTPEPIESEPKPQQPPQPQVDPVAAEWVQQNQWFLTDPTLKAIAEQKHIELNQTQPGLSIQDNLNQVKAHAMEKFPEKFGITQKKRQGFSPVEGTARSASASLKPKTKGWNEIPSDDRKQLKTFVDDETFKDKDEAAKAYWSQ